MGGSEHSRELESPLSRKLITRRDFLGEASLLCASLPGVSHLAASPHNAWFASTQNVAQASIRGKTATLGNGVIASTWEISAAGLRFLRIVDRRTGLAIDGPKS
ncbi:MAG: twin-arginine translocation signal domain-containing protein, partial [Candidatus Acidiferrales bacterium]